MKRVNLRVGPEFETAGINRSEKFEFSFEGQTVEAYPGETVAAALVAAGTVALRRTRVKGQPRGLFCGIGICFDCLVVYNGKPNTRACITPAQSGDVVKMQVGEVGEYSSWLQ